MDRRRFVALVGSALAAPLARAQQAGKPFRIAFLTVASRDSVKHLIDALELGLREQGYVVGRDAVVEFSSPDGDIKRLPDFIEEIVRSRPDVIVTGVNPVTIAFKKATQTIPIVMAIGTEVVGSGIVASLARPGGNVTGLTWDVGNEVNGKRIELLKELHPKMSRMAVIWDPPYKDNYQVEQDKAAAALRLATTWIEWSGNIERDFAEIARWRADALFVHGGGPMYQRRAELNALAVKRRLPTAHSQSDWVEAGGLMCYGPNLPDLFRRAAKHVDRILKGAKPGDLPVEQPTKIDFVVNRKTANSLGLSIPQSVLLRADRVIE